ncbi:MAG: hypothetical protein AAF960_00925 [Bacteroidota bacterium]
MENIKLWIQLHKEDIKGFFKILVPLLVLIFLVQRMPMAIRHYVLSKFDAETMGVVDSLEVRKGIHELEIGGKVVIRNYGIAYHYQIGNERIDRSETIDRTSLIIEQKVKIDKVRKGDSLLVRYDSNNLKRSRLEIK